MMTNLQSSAFVAKTTQLLSSVARLRLLLVMLLTLCVSAAWGAEYTITFKSASSDSSSDLGTSPTVSNVVSSGTSYVASFSGCSKMYVGKSGIKLGSGSATGTMNFTLATNYQSNIKSIKVVSAKYGSDTGTLTLYSGSTSLKSGISPGTDYTHTFSSPTKVTSLKLETSSKRAYITKIVITTEEAATCTTNPTVSAGSNSNITSTTATVSCDDGITSLGSAGCSITSYGFVYGTTTNPTTSNTKVQVGTTYITTDTAFSKELTGLTANTTYYVRPYATNGNGTAYGTQTSFKTLELPKYTVTLMDDESTLTQSTAGSSVTLPSRDGCDGYEFVGWTKTWTSDQTSWTTTAPIIIPDGSYTPSANENLYPVYTKTESTEETTTTTEYILTDLANIKSTDIVVITTYHSTNGTYAMSNHNGTSSAPTAQSVTVSGSKLSADPGSNYKWNISNNNGYLTIYPNGTTSTWLYCTATNNGVRVGTNTNKTFTISTDYLNHTGTSRYLGVYNKQDWRCYTSTTTNIGSQTLKFYVETTTTTSTSTTTTSYTSVPDCSTETLGCLPHEKAQSDESGP